MEQRIEFAVRMKEGRIVPILPSTAERFMQTGTEGAVGELVSRTITVSDWEKHEVEA